MPMILPIVVLQNTQNYVD